MTFKHETMPSPAPRMPSDLPFQMGTKSNQPQEVAKGGRRGLGTGVRGQRLDGCPESSAHFPHVGGQGLGVGSTVHDMKEWSGNHGEGMKILLNCLVTYGSYNILSPEALAPELMEMEGREGQTSPGNVQGWKRLSLVLSSLRLLQSQLGQQGPLPPFFRASCVFLHSSYCHKSRV